MRKTKKVTLGILALGLGTTLAACSSTPPAAKKVTPSSKTVSVGVIIQTTGIPWYSAVKEGMRAAASKYHANISIVSSDNSVVTESNNISEMVVKKPDVIAITPINSVSSVPAVTRAIHAGIPVVVYNNTLDSSLPAAFVGINNLQYGTTAGQDTVPYIKSHMHGVANIATLTQPGFPIITQRVQGFENQVTKLPGVHVVATASYNGSETSAFTAFKEILTAHPNVNLIYAPNEGATDAAVPAEDSIHSSIPVVGLDLDTVGEKDLLTPGSPLKVMVTQNPYRIGYDTITTAVEVAHHVSVPKQLLVPLNVITASNVKAYVAKWPIPD
ncbi:MAG: sugar ABC transporter substrate-binding protein [Actinobacteria bacterium]|nr:sugar ABC transporter substrate-binding protein [Actinomycetota bacterium]MCL5447399.1 sugar ABC transporter substrate-binding protein [Actinomycetota bacterium]